MIATLTDLDEPWSPSAWLDPVDGLVRGDVDGDDLFEPATTTNTRCSPRLPGI